MSSEKLGEAKETAKGSFVKAVTERTESIRDIVNKSVRNSGRLPYEDVVQIGNLLAAIESLAQYPHLDSSELATAVICSAEVENLSAEDFARRLNGFVGPAQEEADDFLCKTVMCRAKSQTTQKHPDRALLQYIGNHTSEV